MHGMMDELEYIVHQVGTEFIRGVSGGERKRTNIGMELIIEPQVLFLDEPTTGLDANTAVSVVQLLKGYRIHTMHMHCVYTWKFSRFCQSQLP